MTKLHLRRQLTNIARLAVVAMLGCSVMLACSDDDTKPAATTGTDAGKPDTGTGADTSTPAPDVAVRATVTYSGALKGPVLVTLFPTPVPAGPPAGTGSNETPTLPGSNTVDLKNVPPGKYSAFAYIMTGAEHRQGPSTEDPKGGPVDVTVTATATATVTIPLTDPPASDGGDEGGDASDAGDAADG